MVVVSQSPGLIMALWLSGLSMAIHAIHHGAHFEAIVFCAAQGACFLSMCLEAGAAESEEPRKGYMVVFRLASAIGVASHTAVSLFF